MMSILAIAIVVGGTLAMWGALRLMFEIVAATLLPDDDEPHTDPPRHERGHQP